MHTTVASSHTCTEWLGKLNQMRLIGTIVFQFTLPCHTLALSGEQLLGHLEHHLGANTGHGMPVVTAVNTSKVSLRLNLKVFRAIGVNLTLSCSAHILYVRQ